MSQMANYWAAHGWRVTLVTYDDERASRYPLHHAVAYVPLGIAQTSVGAIEAFVSNLKRLGIIRKAIRRTNPDVVISFLDKINVRTIISCFGMTCPVIVSERVDPRGQSIGLVWDTLRRWTYRHATCLVAQTNHALEYFPEVIRNKGIVIPNPVTVPQLSRSKGGDIRDKVVIGMGRLVHQKGFDLLVRAFSVVSRTHVDWSLVVWGDGELRHDLERLRDELGMLRRVSFAGWTEEPFNEMRRAGLFVLSSRYEGFPNVLVEAMACGAPVVSFDCASGPRQIISDGVDGVLVPVGDVHALAATMDRVMDDDSMRKRLGKSGAYVVERFRKERIMTMWGAAIREAIKAKRMRK